jgi:hypothetical protein
MSEKKEYPKGITFFAPRENAPQWVKGSIIISPEDLIKWLQENKHLTVDTQKYGKQYKLQVTEKGLQVDTWKPKIDGINTGSEKAPTQTDDQDLPF